MAKNIVVFSDGTGQEGGVGNNTNVYKLFNMIEDRTPQQIAFYDKGLGTSWNKISGNVGGAGISRNIQDCYRFIFEHFESGDSIYLFGFSRGATTVRSLSNFIHYFGMLPKSRPELIKQAWKIYEIENDDKRKRKADEFVGRHHTMWARIKFIGCFDTVAALGAPFEWMATALNAMPFFRHKFHDLRLSDSVENAYHALSIDDPRETFHPTLWHPDVASHQHLEQVWFSGVHTDVGGGYAEQELAGIPLVWMTEKAVSHGLRIFPRNKVKITEDVNGTMHDPREKLWAKLYRKKPRAWDAAIYGTPVIHESVFQRTLNAQNGQAPAYTPWIAEQTHTVEKWCKLGEQDWRQATS